MIAAVLFFVAGVVCLQWQPQLPHPGWIGLLLLLPLGFLLPSRLRPTLFFSAGVLWAMVQSHLVKQLPNPLSYLSSQNPLPVLGAHTK